MSSRDPCFTDVRDVGLDVVLVSSRNMFFRCLFSVVGVGLGNVILVSSRDRDPGVTDVLSAGRLGLAEAVVVESRPFRVVEKLCAHVL